MAEFIKNLFGGAQSVVSSVVTGAVDDAFADFATAASPAAPSHAATSALTGAAAQAKPTTRPSIFGAPTGLQGRPFTKWYRVWERVTIEDFYQELFILPIVLAVIVVNVIGARANAQRAKRWASAHVPLLEAEFAQVGTERGATVKTGKDTLRQKAKNEYIAYATGRTNIAFVDVKLTLYKRYNPFLWLVEAATSFLIDAMAPPVERVEATAVCFDGKEKALLPMSASAGNSTFDGFVWAVVHKDKMKTLREERYDLSLTATRDHSKLPDWASVMTESAEISDALLTPELIKAIHDVGENLEALIISDQPIDAPKKLNDIVPRKRVTLVMELSESVGSVRLFEYFLHMPDQLASNAHFRPEALRKVRTTREEEARKIRKLDEDEKAEERRVAGDKAKKEERDRRLTSSASSFRRKKRRSRRKQLRSEL